MVDSNELLLCCQHEKGLREDKSLKSKSLKGPWSTKQTEFTNNANIGSYTTVHCVRSLASVKNQT